MRAPLHFSLGRIIFAWLAALCAAATLAASAWAAPVRVDAVEVELIAPSAALRAGHTEWIGLRIRHDPHWHTYWRNPGDSGLATTLELKVPPGFEVGALQWPVPARFLIAPLASYGYEDEVLLPLQVRVPDQAVGSRARFEARASWLMCRDVCIPGDATLTLELPVQALGTDAGRSANAALFDRALAALPTQQRELSVAAAGSTLSIDLGSMATEALSGGARIEFFPFSEAGLRHAAPQVIRAASNAPGQPSRLELSLSDDGVALVRKDADEAARTLAAGVLVVGDRAWEIIPRPEASLAPAGVELARVEAKPVVMPQQTAGGGSRSGSGLLSALGLGSGTPRQQGALSAGSSAGSIGSGAAQSPGSDRTLALMLVFAVLGGLILNLMPCVFPVIGLKVLAFAEHAHDPQAAKRLLPAGPTYGARSSALAFAAGVVLSFLLLGVLMLALKAAGISAGWGFQLQSPVFVSLMALLFVAIALNLAGVFEVGVGMTRLGRFDAAPSAPASASRRWFANLGSGALAVLVATPCTAPFMASALGFTLSSSALESLAVFAAIGLGMALPYLLLGWFPAWLRWLPRPGRWMETLRQFLAFPMLATSAWLVWVLGQQAGIDAVFALALAAVLLGLGAWLLGRFVQARGWSHAKMVALVAFGAVAASIWLAVHYAAEGAPPVGASGARAPGADAGDAAAWEPWSAQRVAQALAEGRPVFVDFTAAWCVSCQANKKLVLDREPIVQEMAQRKVLRLRADWTQRDPVITAELARHGRNGVPLYLLYAPSAQRPRVLPELLTVGLMTEALGSLSRSK
jgi:thiol:disulfide interchange protein/DsbC/DsbD-like thiol-disulfide interchange protein